MTDCIHQQGYIGDNDYCTLHQAPCKRWEFIRPRECKDRELPIEKEVN